MTSKKPDPYNDPRIPKEAIYLGCSSFINSHYLYYYEIPGDKQPHSIYLGDKDDKLDRIYCQIKVKEIKNWKNKDWTPAEPQQ